MYPIVFHWNGDEMAGHRTFRFIATKPLSIVILTRVFGVSSFSPLLSLPIFLLQICFLLFVATLPGVLFPLMQDWSYVPMCCRKTSGDNSMPWRRQSSCAWRGRGSASTTSNPSRWLDEAPSERWVEQCSGSASATFLHTPEVCYH